MDNWFRLHEISKIIVKVMHTFCGLGSCDSVIGSIATPVLEDKLLLLLLLLFLIIALVVPLLFLLWLGVELGEDEGGVVVGDGSRVLGTRLVGNRVEGRREDGRVGVINEGVLLCRLCEVSTTGTIGGNGIVGLLLFLLWFTLGGGRVER